MKWFFSAFTLLALLWIAGGVWFVQTLPQHQDWHTKTDAIVVLTGGKNRIEVSVDLLDKNLGGKLFISGVDPSVKDKNELSTRTLPQGLLDAIDLGYESKNTYENALEVADWVQKHNYQSIRLVTSDYHLRRSYMELRSYLPQVQILPHAVISFKTHKDWWTFDNIAFMVGEYNKYIEAFVRFELNNIFRSLID